MHSVIFEASSVALIACMIFKTQRSCFESTCSKCTIESPITASELSLTMIETILEFSLVCGTLWISGSHLSISSSATIYELSIISCRVFTRVKSLSSSSMLATLYPFSVINCLISKRYKGTIALRPSSNPITLINITICVGQSTSSVILCFQSKSLISRIVSVCDLAESFPGLHVLSQPVDNKIDKMPARIKT